MRGALEFKAGRMWLDPWVKLLRCKVAGGRGTSKNTMRSVARVSGVCGVAETKVHTAWSSLKLLLGTPKCGCATISARSPLASEAAPAAPASPSRPRVPLSVLHHAGNSTVRRFSLRLVFSNCNVEVELRAP